MIHGSKNTRVRLFSILFILQEKKRQIFTVLDIELYKTNTVSVDQVSLDLPKNTITVHVGKLDNNKSKNFKDKINYNQITNYNFKLW